MGQESGKSGSIVVNIILSFGACLPSSCLGFVVKLATARQAVVMNLWLIVALSLSTTIANLLLLLAAFQ